MRLYLWVIRIKRILNVVSKTCFQAYLRDQNVLYGLSKELFDFLLPLVMHARLSTILIYRSFISNNCIKPLMESDQKVKWVQQTLETRIIENPTILFLTFYRKNLGRNFGSWCPTCWASLLSSETTIHTLPSKTIWICSLKLVIFSLCYF